VSLKEIKEKRISYAAQEGCEPLETYFKKNKS